PRSGPRSGVHVSKSFSLDDVLAAASPVERVVSVCVAGKLIGEYEHLKTKMERGFQSLGGNAKLRDQLAELERKIDAATYDFRFRALSPKAWSDLVAQHPDKSGNKLFNIETFPTAAIAACCVEPEGMDDPEKVAALLDKLSTAQQAELFDAAW